MKATILDISKDKKTVTFFLDNNDDMVLIEYIDWYDEAKAEEIGLFEPKVITVGRVKERDGEWDYEYEYTYKPYSKLSKDQVKELVEWMYENPSKFSETTESMIYEAYDRFLNWLFG